MRRRLPALALLCLLPFLAAEKCFEEAAPPTPRVPDAPTIGGAVSGNASAEVSFTAPADSGSQPITSFTVTCSAGVNAQSASGDASPITVTSLANGVQYSCTVVAVSVVGMSDPSAGVLVTPSTTPGAPTIGTVTAANQSAVVNFTAPSSTGGSAITGYTATCTATGAAGITGTGGGTSSSITVNNLTNGTQYACNVYATNARGNSSASSNVNVTPANVPGAPTIGAATAGNASASIAFTAPASNGGSAITTYAATCTASGHTTAAANGTSSPINVTGMTNGVQYACNVRAANAVGAGAVSADVNVTPVGPPGAPTIGAATAGDAQASIAFTAPASTGGSAITGYTVTCTANGQTQRTGTGSASPISVTSMANAVAYSCSVTATNAIGTSGASSSVSVTPRTVPSAPTIGTATPGNTTASIAFTAGSNGGSAITGFTVTCTASGQTTRTGTGTASPIAVTTLTNDIQYACSATATNAAGTGAASGTVNVTPAAPVSTSSVMCPYSYNQQNTVALLQSTVSWTCNATTRAMTSTQVPDYPSEKTFQGNPNIMAAINASVTFTLTPSQTGSITSGTHIVGWARNGVKFEPSTGEKCPAQGPQATTCPSGFSGTMTFNVEALDQTLFSAGVDNANAHIQPNGAYHYHGMPNKYLSWLSSSGTDTSVTPTVKHYLVGFAVDGFPVYAKYGYDLALDATSTVRALASSYRKKTTPDDGRVSTGTVAMGTFTQDWEYAAGTGDLDECNGRFAKTPEFPNGIYAYWITTAFPYIQRCHRGTVPP